MGQTEASRFSSSPAVTLPNNPTFNIARTNSSWTHTVEFAVQKRPDPRPEDDSHYKFINKVTNVGTSGSIPLTPDMVSDIISTGFPNILPSGEVEWSTGRLKLYTEQLGQYTDWVSITLRLPASASATGGSGQLKAGQVISGTLNNFQSNTNYSYDLVFNFNNYAIPVATDLKTNAWSFTLTQEQVDSMLAKIPNAKDSWGQVTVQSKYNGTPYGKPVSGARISLATVESEVRPIFNTNPTYGDTVPLVTDITEDPKALIARLSKLNVTAPSGYAQSRGGATLVSIRLVHGAQRVTLAYNASGFSYTFEPPTAITDNTVTVTLTDSRGYETSYTADLAVYMYNAPIVDFTVTRKNNFQSESDVVLYSTWTPLVIGGVRKNGILSAKVQYKKTNTTTWSTAVDIPYVLNGENIGNDNLVIELDNEFSWNVRVILQDKLGALGTSSKDVLVQPGRPMMYIDKLNDTVAFGDFINPDFHPGALTVKANQYLNSGRPGIQMSNSDIAGVNSIRFADASDNNGEGLAFLKPGKPLDSVNREDYDYMYMRDGGVFVNSDTNPIFTVSDDGKNMMYGNGWLWQGGNWPNPNQTITPAKKLSECRNGWMLMWAKYDSGTTYDTDIVFTPVHKGSLKHGNQWRRFLISNNTDTIGVKALHIYDGYLVGARDNSTTTLNNNKIVLRAVFEF